MRKLQPAAYFLSLLLLASCDTEDYDFNSLEEVQWSPTYALPIATGHLGLEDLLSPEDSATLGIGADDVFFFEYREEFESDELSELIDIADLSFSRYVELPIPLVVPAKTGVDLPTLQAEITIDSESELELLRYKAGQLLYTLNNQLDLPVRMELSFPEVIRDGQPLRASGEVSASAATQNISLSGYTADLTSADNPYNTIPFEIKFSAFNNTDRPVHLSAGDRITATLELVNQEFSYIEGNFGDINFELPEMVMQVGPFDEFLKYDMQLAEMDLELHIHNQYGVPIDLHLPEFNAINDQGSAMEIHTSPASPIALQAAREPGDQRITSIGVVNGDQLIKHNPEEIQIQGLAQLNEAPSGGSSFLNDTANLVFGLEATIPLVGSFRDLEIRDTIKADLQDSFEELDIKTMQLNTQLINEFPLGGDFQIYMLDENLQMIDSLLLPGQTQIITSSTVSPEGDLQDPGVYKEFITISEEKFDALQKTAHLILAARLNTVIDENGQRPDVRFKSQYRLHIELAGLVELDVSIKP